MKIKLTLELRAEKKINICSGGITTKISADNPLLKINDKIVIPASTIKGILRTCLIRVAHLLDNRSKNRTINYSVYPEKIEGDDIVTELFGKPEKSGKIFVESAYLETESFVLTHVRINDKTRTQEEGHLFTTEYIPRGAKFRVVIEGYDLSRKEFIALLSAIAEMNYERIGKSGAVSVRIIKKESIVDEELLRDQLAKILWEGLTE